MMTVRRLLLLFLDQCIWKLDSNIAVNECDEDIYLINRGGHHVVLMVLMVESTVNALHYPLYTSCNASTAQSV